MANGEMPRDLDYALPGAESGERVRKALVNVSLAPGMQGAWGLIAFGPNNRTETISTVRLPVIPQSSVYYMVPLLDGSIHVGRQRDEPARSARAPSLPRLMLDVSFAGVSQLHPTLLSEENVGVVAVVAQRVVGFEVEAQHETPHKTPGEVDALGGIGDSESGQSQIVSSVSNSLMLPLRKPIGVALHRLTPGDESWRVGVRVLESSDAMADANGRREFVDALRWHSA